MMIFQARARFLHAMCSMFEIHSCVRGHHVYKAIWMPFVGKALSCERQEDNTTDPYAVAVKKKSGQRLIVVGHVGYICCNSHGLEQNSSTALLR